MPITNVKSSWESGDLIFDNVGSTSGKVEFRCTVSGATPSNDGDLANKAYVDTEAASKLDFTAGTDQQIARYDGTDAIEGSTVYIDDSGNVGIGTASPTANLSVVALSAQDALMRVVAANTEYDARLFIGESDTQGMTIEYDGTDNVGYIGMNSEVDPTGAWSKRVRMSRDGTEVSFPAGNVGIGTNSPGTRKLKIATSDASNDVGAEIAMERTTGINYGAMIYATGNGANSNYGLYISAADATSSNRALWSQDGDVILNAASGDTGIGTGSPAAKLDVNGDLVIQYGTSVNEFSTDGTLAGNSDDAVPTEQAVKTYVDGLVSGVTTSIPTASGTMTVVNGVITAYTPA